MAEEERRITIALSGDDLERFEDVEQTAGGVKDAVVYLLERHLELEQRVDDLREDRDQWRGVANRLSQQLSED